MSTRAQKTRVRRPRRAKARSAWGRVFTDEPLCAVYPASGRNHAADDRPAPRRPRQLPIPPPLRPPRSRLPHDPGANLLPRRQPGGHDKLRHRTARTPVRGNARPQPDAVAKLRRRIGDNVAVHAGPLARHRRARSASRHQRCRKPAPVRPPRPTNLRQGKPRRRANHHPGTHQQNHGADADRGPRRNPPRAENQPDRRRGSRLHLRRSPPRRAHPSQPARAGRAGPEHRRSAHHDRQPQRQHPERQFRRPHPGHNDKRQRPTARRRLLRQRDNRLQERRAGTPSPTWPNSCKARKTPGCKPG